MIPTGLIYPESLDVFMLEITINGYTVKITRSIACLACGDKIYL
jgi:hypothetical protein